MSVFTRNTGRVLVIMLMGLLVAWYLFSRRSSKDGVVIAGDTAQPVKQVVQASTADTVRPDHVRVAPSDIPVTDKNNMLKDAKGASAAGIVSFAKTLLGVPYVYASSDPNVGFDCSGFITYVFRHFNIEVPRSSIEFSNVGKTIDREKAKQGDLILFTGTNELERHVGHMGIVVSNDIAGGLQFIHATSGKAMAVTISPLSEQYQKRFVRVCRII